jgi:hypothetical protein
LNSSSSTGIYNYFIKGLFGIKSVIEEVEDQDNIDQRELQGQVNATVSLATQVWKFNCPQKITLIRIWSLPASDCGIREREEGEEEGMRRSIQFLQVHHRKKPLQYHANSGFFNKLYMCG